jgi:hypothetical protein
MFYGLPAWVGAIQSPTICDWWNGDPSQLNWDRSLLYTVDLSMTPSAAIAGRIQVSQIEVDDYAGSGGRTTIGPLWPSGTSIGACWVSDNYLAKAGAAGQTKPAIASGASGYNYEYMTIQYIGEQQNRRFYGFQAKVLQTQSNLSLVQIWNPGTGAGTAQPAGAWWLDLAADADPGTPPLAPTKPGALFLDSSTVRQIAVFEAKVPPHKGSFAFPETPLAPWTSTASC